MRRELTLPRIDGSFCPRVLHPYEHSEQTLPRKDVTMRQADFTMDCYPENVVIKGYTSGHTWNGWSCPLFTKDSAMQIMELQKDIIAYSKEMGCDYYELTYNEQDESFELSYRCDEGEEYESVEVIHPITKDGLKLYDIGSSNWCWYEVQD